MHIVSLRVFVGTWLHDNAIGKNVRPCRHVQTGRTWLRAAIACCAWGQLTGIAQKPISRATDVESQASMLSRSSLPQCEWRSTIEHREPTFASQLTIVFSDKPVDRSRASI